MISNDDIIQTYNKGVDYYLLLNSNNINNMNLGLETIFNRKIDKLFFILTALKYRIDRDIFDRVSTKLYYKIIRLLPIN